MQRFLVTVVLLVSTACSAGTGDPGTGDEPSEAGSGGAAMAATGGASQAGGAGGAPMASTGGAAATGGQASALTGGTSSTGGTASTGGAPQATGGTPATGGMAATGGAMAATGGRPATGGAASTGGAPGLDPFTPAECPIWKAYWIPAGECLLARGSFYVSGPTLCLNEPAVPLLQRCAAFGSDTAGSFAYLRAAPDKVMAVTRPPRAGCDSLCTPE